MECRKIIKEKPKENDRKVPIYKHKKLLKEKEREERTDFRFVV